METVARAALWLTGVVLAGWGALALGFAGPGPAPLRTALAALPLAAAGWALRRRSARAAAVGLAALAAALLAWWSTLTPSGSRDWAPDVARAPTAEIRGDLVTVRGVRSFRYATATEFEERWEDRRYDLSRLRTLDLFLSHWGSPDIAHTILSWGFDDGQHLAVSIETRKEKGESYSAVRGFFRQFELYYVVADERDLVGLRTNHRGEEVYLYRLRPRRPEGPRKLLESYLAGMNHVAAHPTWYNALVTNCTTTIRLHVLHAGGRLPLDWRLLLNGHLPEMLYEAGVLDATLPFEALRARSRIDPRVAAGDGPDFSARIRAPGP
jgi:hypothetical protein